MTVNKRKKTSRNRGSHTHGWGSMKKHRGAGNRGGAGNAGTGKLADSKKPSIWKGKPYFGRYGFVSKSRRQLIKTINISEIEEKLSKLLTEKKAVEKDGFYIIDLKAIGFNKLLGKGAANKKLKITADYASNNAIKIVKKAGGEVVLLKAKNEKIKKPAVKNAVESEAEA